MTQRRHKGDGGRTCTLAGCDQPHDARGYCREHYKKARRAGLPKLAKPTIEQRFWAKVDFHSSERGCWEWTGSLRAGYGRFGYKAGDLRDAHRLSWELLVGPIPDGMQIDHLCRNPKCVNPAHLEPVEPGENYRRGFGFGGVNHRKTHCPKEHPYSGPNLYIDAHGARRCRTCIREQREARNAA